MPVTTRYGRRLQPQQQQQSPPIDNAVAASFVSTTRTTNTMGVAAAAGGGGGVGMMTPTTLSTPRATMMTTRTTLMSIATATTAVTLSSSSTQLAAQKKSKAAAAIEPASVNSSSSSSSSSPRKRSKRLQGTTTPPADADAATNTRRSSSSVPVVVTPNNATSAFVKNDKDGDDDDDDSLQQSLPHSKKVKKGTSQSRKNNNSNSDSSSSSLPPKDWKDIYQVVQELRQDRTAPCDHSGAEALPDPHLSPREFRFQVLISLMLSSQTKDAVVGDAIRSMQRDNVLNVHAIAAMSAQELNAYICRVGFHNNKTKYIQETVQVLLRDYDGDIPPTATAMMKLPGVGPKMAYIAENIAWKKQSGIGVDTHMHRLFNKLKWVQSKTPEQTRVQLEAWLPKELWADVNLLWVGFGQEVQQFGGKLLQKALDSSDPVKALQVLKQCGMDCIKESKKAGLEEEIKQFYKV